MSRPQAAAPVPPLQEWGEGITRSLILPTCYRERAGDPHHRATSIAPTVSPQLLLLQSSLGTNSGSFFPWIPQPSRPASPALQVSHTCPPLLGHLRTGSLQLPLGCRWPHTEGHQELGRLRGKDKSQTIPSSHQSLSFGSYLLVELQIIV